MQTKGFIERNNKIRDVYALGKFSQSEIASQFGVTQSRINAILHPRRYCIDCRRRIVSSTYCMTCKRKAVKRSLDKRLEKRRNVIAKRDLIREHRLLIKKVESEGRIILKNLFRERLNAKASIFKSGSLDTMLVL